MSANGPDKHRGFLARFAELGPAWISALTAVLVALTSAGFFAGRAAGQPRPSPTVTVTAPARIGGGQGSASPPAAAGTQVGSYPVDLTGSYGVPLGPAQPAQSQYSADGIGDLVKIDSRIGPGGADQMVLLPDGTTPTYQQCASATNFSGQIVPVTGSSLCIIETTGYIAGAEVTAVGATVSSVTLTITVWKKAA
jgi:hypothetical protein